LRLALVAIFPFASAYFLSYLLRAVNAVIAPDLVAEFRLSPAELGLLTSAYLVAFALFQLPLGILLDRYGPRRVQAAMLLIAAAGCGLFAIAPNFATLAFARGLIGLGFAGGLMASFKATSLWIPAARRALVNSCVMVIGAAGLLVATAPTEILANAIGWRAAFGLFASLIVLGALYIFLVVPQTHEGGSSPSFSTQLGELGRILKLPVFWRLAPLLSLTAGAQIAIQTLWAGPWFPDVMGLSREDSARNLTYMALAFMAGILSVGIITDRLTRRGVHPLTVMVIYLVFYLAAQTIIIFGPLSWALPAWLIVAAGGQVAIVAYPWLAEHVGNELAGRSNAAINFTMFVTAFIAQYVIGIIIGLFEPVGDGYAPEAYSWAFGLFLALQLLALAWYAFAPIGSLSDRPATA
jgi:MFS family permease